jgi:uncharacterized lipoprotein YmbA
VTQAMQRLCACLLVAMSIVPTLANCSSPDPVLYTIAPAGGPAHAGGPTIILLDRIDIPRYLDRSQIVKSSADYRLDVKSNDWWGEPLSPMLRRILRQELTQRLPGSTVLSESGAVSATPDATIDLDLQRLDEDASGNVMLQAQASLSLKGRKEPILRSFHFSVPSSAPTSAAEVAAVSIVVGQLADGLAAMLTER